MSPEQKQREAQKDKSKQKTHEILVEQKSNGGFAKIQEVADVFETTIRQAEHNQTTEKNPNNEER